MAGRADNYTRKHQITNYELLPVTARVVVSNIKITCLMGEKSQPGCPHQPILTKISKISTFIKLFFNYGLLCCVLL